MDNALDKSTQNSFFLPEAEYQALLSSLNRKIALIDETTSEKEFFLLLAEYYKFITTNNITTKAIDVLFQQYQSEIETIDKLRKKTFEESQTVFEKIKELAITKKLITKEQLNLIERYYIKQDKLSESELKILAPSDVSNHIFITFREYYSWLVGKTQSLAGVPFELSIKGAVERIIQAIYHAGHKDLVAKYIELKNDSEGKEYINDYFVSASAQDFSDLKKIVDRKLELSGWNLLHKLELIPLCAFDYPTLWKQLKEEDKIAEIMALGSYVKEMENILEGRSRDRLFFKVKEYKLYLSIFQDKLLEILQEANKDLSISSTASNGLKDLSTLSGLLKERPKHLPDSKTPQELIQRLTLEETPEGDFLLNLGSRAPIRFQANQDISYMMHVFYVYKEQWINFELIYSAVWGKNDYKEQQALKNKPAHDKIRSTISAIRTKLRQANLGEAILIESGHDAIGTQGEGWFRLHVVAV